MTIVYLQINENEIERQRFETMFAQRSVKTTKDPGLADLILFGGGIDVNPKLYGQSKHPQTFFSEERDKKDIAVFEKYKGKPMVGICRGAQLGHVLAGGYLIQDINSHYCKHYTTVEDKVITTDSDHHQAMACSKVGDILGISRVANKKEICKDGKITDIQKVLNYDIEIMMHPDINFLSIQSHPEYHGNVELRNTFWNLLKRIFNIS